jgi:hypothetical protein
MAACPLHIDVDCRGGIGLEYLTPGDPLHPTAILMPMCRGWNETKHEHTDRCAGARSGGPALLPAQGAAAGLAPAFALQLLDGKTLRLADYRGSPVILIVLGSVVTHLQP